MALVITSEPAGELLTVDEAKRHLRVYDGSLDDEVTALVRAARDYCERYTQRTLRTTVTRTLTLADWWCSSQWLPWPPLLAVSSVTYYDASNALQTLASSNYVVELATNGGGRIMWAWNATIPSVYSRPDAITVTFTAGYADATAIPPVALQAFKTKLTELWGAGSENEGMAASKSTDRLLAMVDWTGYA